MKSAPSSRARLAGSSFSLHDCAEFPDDVQRNGRIFIKAGNVPLGGRRLERESIAAIRTAVGIEALVSLVEVAHLSRAQAVDVMKWSARALLRTAMAEQKRPHPKKRPGRNHL